MERIDRYNYPELKDNEKYSPDKTSGEYFFINHFYKNQSIEFAKLRITGSSRYYTYYDFSDLEKADSISKIKYLKLDETSDIAEIRPMAIQMPMQLNDDIINTHDELFLSLKFILNTIKDNFRYLKETREKQPSDIPEYTRHTPGIYHLIYATESDNESNYYLVKIDYKSETNAKVFYQHWIYNRLTGTIFKNQESVFIYGPKAEFGNQYDSYCCFCPITENEYNSFITELNEWIQQHRYFKTSLYGLHI